ncbi:MAG: hypothetical protein ACKVT0_15255 [Planctomycetaceae bacterium]
MPSIIWDSTFMILTVRQTITQLAAASSEDSVDPLFAPQIDASLS